MPALPMKIESITSCVKDCLHSLCQHSNKICKKKSFWIHKSPKLLDMETPDLLDFQTTRCQSGCHEVAEILEDMKTETAIHSEEQAGLENFKVEEQLLSSEVLSSATMRTSLDECPSNLARVSSPIVQSNDIDCDSSESPDRDSGSEDDLAKEQMEGNSHDNRKTYCLGHESSHDLDLRFLEESNADARRTNDTESGLDDIIKSNLVQELEWAESNVFLDMNGNCIMLPFPFPEDTVSTSLIQGQGFGEEFLLNTESSWFNMVTHHSKLYNQNLANAGPIDYDELDSVDPLLFIRNFLDLSDLEANSLPALLPKETSRGKSITLVLDLDETLVHSTLEPCTDADFTIQVSLNMEQHTFYVRQRPFLKTFLEKVSEMFEIVLFTASQSFYAEQLLDNLDPDRKFFSRREYRETCVLSDGIFTKDLTVLGVDLAKVAIIDNSPQVFRWQVNNGIPIKSWFDDPSDSELISLIPFLETLVEVDDVRPIIAKRFGGS